MSPGFEKANTLLDMRSTYPPGLAVDSNTALRLAEWDCLTQPSLLRCTSISDMLTTTLTYIPSGQDAMHQQSSMLADMKMSGYNGQYLVDADSVLIIHLVKLIN